MTTQITSVDTGSAKTWASGDYSRIGNLWLQVSELLCDTIPIRPGEQVLDVATGSGNTALAARRRFGVVTGIDYVPDLLDHARVRAAADGLEITYEEGDAERLRFPDGSFDVAVSTFGVMYVPDQRLAAGEMLRVVRPGGRIGLASWTPHGFIGRLLRLVDKHTAGSDTVAAPTLWGTEDHVRTLFGAGVSALRSEERLWHLRFPSTDAFIAHFRADFGPLNRAYAILDQPGQHALTTDLTKLIAEQNIAADGTAVVPSSYLEVVLDRAPATP